MFRFPRLRDHLEMLVPPLSWDRSRWRDNGGPPVMLLHCLWRSYHAMEPLARALSQKGFSTLNLPSPRPLDRSRNWSNASVRRSPNRR